MHTQGRQGKNSIFYHTFSVYKLYLHEATKRVCWSAVFSSCVYRFKRTTTKQDRIILSDTKADISRFFFFNHFLLLLLFFFWQNNTRRKKKALKASKSREDPKPNFNFNRLISVCYVLFNTIRSDSSYFVWNSCVLCLILQ